MLITRLFFILILSFIVLNSFAQNVFKTKNSFVYFTSDAPLEVVKAYSRGLQGVLNPKTKRLAFKLKIVTFEGFNSNLQKTHFNESFMETETYPLAQFEGKIIENIDFSKDNKHSVTAQGKFIIHGIEKQKTVKGTLEVRGDKIIILSNFDIGLEEFKIKIPKIVYKKIAEVIKVKIRADLRLENL